MTNENKEVNKGGRPIIELSKEQLIELSALSHYLSKGQIADYFGISRPTFDAIIARQEEVGVKFNKGRAVAIANVAKGLVKQAMDGNVTASIFFLKTRAGWTETQAIEHTSPDGSMTPITNNFDLKDLTDDELRTLAAISTKSKTD